MKFLEDLNVDKTKKIGITNFLSNITQRPGSHKGGWTRLLRCQLKFYGFQDVTILNNKNKLSEFDYIIFDLGAEFSGVINLFGGLNDKCFERFQEIMSFHGRMFSWRNELPNLVNDIKLRQESKSTFDEFKKIAKDEKKLFDIQEVLNQVEVFDHVYKTNKLLIGDSHTPQVFDTSWIIARRDGRTLKGLISPSPKDGKNTIQKTIDILYNESVKIDHLMIHCSSIDIRHHLSREENPEQATKLLAENLVQSVQKFNLESVTLVHTVGIEDISRKLPKTGYYKGTAYTGTWEQRNNLRNIFNEVLNKASDEKIKVLAYPKEYFMEDGKLDQKFMEVPNSVHLSPEYYRYDLENNKNRWGY